MLYMQVEMALTYKTIRYVKEKDFPEELLRLEPKLGLFVTFCRFFLQWHLLFEWGDNLIFYCRGLCSLLLFFYVFFNIKRVYICGFHWHGHISSHVATTNIFQASNSKHMIELVRWICHLKGKVIRTGHGYCNQFALTFRSFLAIFSLFYLSVINWLIKQL